MFPFEFTSYSSSSKIFHQTLLRDPIILALHLIGSIIGVSFVLTNQPLVLRGLIFFMVFAFNLFLRFTDWWSSLHDSHTQTFGLLKHRLYINPETEQYCLSYTDCDWLVTNFFHLSYQLQKLF